MSRLQDDLADHGVRLGQLHGRGDLGERHPGRHLGGQLYLGLVAWTRLHGLISLELGQHLPATGVDPALLYEAEVAALVRLAFPEPRPAGVLS
jgi:hypothetical protein